MKIQTRRWFAVGLTSGSLAISLLAGSGAVGAAGSGNLGRDNERDNPSVSIAAVAPERTVTIVTANVATPTATQDQVFSRDART